MEEEKRFQIKVSATFLIDLDNIFQYGIETFGLHQVELYENEILSNIIFKFQLRVFKFFLQSSIKLSLRIFLPQIWTKEHPSIFMSCSFLSI